MREPDPASIAWVARGDVTNRIIDSTPFGLGTYGSRSTPVSGAAAALVARKVKAKAQIIASGMLEVLVADLEWTKRAFNVKGDPSKSVTIQDIAMKAHGAGDLPEGLEGGLVVCSANRRRSCVVGAGRADRVAVQTGSATLSSQQCRQS